MYTELPINRDFCLTFPYIEKNVPKFTIVIACYNKQRIIGKTVSLLQRAGINQKIVLVDDNSTDKTLEEIKKIKDVLVVENKTNLGWGRTNNKGLEFVDTEYVVFMDADFLVGTYGWLISWYLNNKHKENIGESGEFNYGNVLGFDKIYDHVVSQPWMQNQNEYAKRVLTKVYDMDTCAHICGNYKIFKTDFIRKIGGFSDNMFPPCVEVEISLKVKYHGYKIDNYRIPFRQTTDKFLPDDIVNSKYEMMDSILEQQRKMLINGDKILGLLYNPVDYYLDQAVFNV